MENEKRYAVIQFPMWEYDVDQLQSIYKSISNSVEIPVIMIPHEFSWREMSLEQLKQMRDLIDKVIIPSREDQEHDTNC